MIVGVDGCKGGWIAVSRDNVDQTLNVLIHSDFASLLSAYPDEAIICVDMPIGLPTLASAGGREAERCVRPFLKKRKSSVFSIPSRAAVYTALPPFEKGTYSQAHARACSIARQTSQPSAGFPIQAFGIFPKIREIDTLLRNRISLAGRIFESHPEFAFFLLNSGIEMQNKKSEPQGEQERRHLLVKYGYTTNFLQQRDFNKAKTDDFLDACVMMVIAERIRIGIAQPYPNPPSYDTHGIHIAIWG